MKTSIVIPTYNEKDNLPLIVDSLFGLEIKDLEILIVDDNSPDGTGIIAEELKEKYPSLISVLHREGKQGLGTAYLAGFQFCLDRGAEQIVQMDADFSHDPQKVVELIAGFAVCIRGKPGSEMGCLEEEFIIFWKFLRKSDPWGANTGYYRGFQSLEEKYAFAYTLA